MLETLKEILPGIPVEIYFLFLLCIIAFKGIRFTDELRISLVYIMSVITLAVVDINPIYNNSICLCIEFFILEFASDDIYKIQHFNLFYKIIDFLFLSIARYGIVMYLLVSFLTVQYREASLIITILGCSLLVTQVMRQRFSTNTITQIMNKIGSLQIIDSNDSSNYLMIVELEDKYILDAKIDRTI